MRRNCSTMPGNPDCSGQMVNPEPDRHLVAKSLSSPCEYENDEDMKKFQESVLCYPIEGWADYFAPIGMRNRYDPDCSTNALVA